MRQLFYIFILLIASAAESQCQPTTPLDSIRFSKLDYGDALALARSEGKLICVFTYHNTETFKSPMIDKHTADLYNSNFINLKLALDQSFPKFSKVFELNYPFSASNKHFLKAIYFITDTRELLHFTFFPGYQTNQEIAQTALSEASAVLSEKSDLKGKSLQTRFDSGERDPDFLIDYCDYNMIIGDFQRIEQIKNQSDNFFEEKNIVNPFTLYAVRHLFLPPRHAFVKSLLNHLSEFRTRFGLEPLQIATRFTLETDFNDHTGQDKKFTTEELAQFRKAIAFLWAQKEGPDYAREITYKATLKAFVREEKYNELMEYMNETLTSKSLKEDQFIYLHLQTFQLFNEKELEKSWYTPFNNWAKSVTKYLRKHDLMIPSNEHALLNYEMAEIYWRHGKRTKAGNLSREAFLICKRPHSRITLQNRQKIEIQFSKYDPHRRNFFTY